MHRRFPSLLLSLVLLSPLAVCHAGMDKEETALLQQALKSGTLLPISHILEQLERTHPGQVTEVELEYKPPQWYYKIQMMSPDGSPRQLRLDATTGKPG